MQGCLEWQAQGLSPPAAVVEATGEYFEDEDALGRWLAECCDLDPVRVRGNALVVRVVEGLGGPVGPVRPHGDELPQRTQGARAAAEALARQPERLPGHLPAPPRLHR